MLPPPSSRRPIGATYPPAIPAVFLCLSLLSACSPALAADRSWITPDYVREHVIAWYPIGWQVRDASKRNVDEARFARGWQGFVDEQVLPTIERHGLRRVMLHNPFGTLPDEPMQFDQYLAAREAGLDWLTDGFVAAWRPLTERGIEVIGYMGSPRLDSESQQLLEAGDSRVFRERAWAAIAPLVAAGMAIGYDAAAAAEEDSPTYRFAQAMRARGIRVYIEAVPRADYDWWFDWPVIVREDFWQEADPFLPWRSRKIASREDLRKELARIVRVDDIWFPNHGPEGWPESACRIIAEGDTLIIGGHFLAKPQRRIDTLVECARRH